MNTKTTKFLAVLAVLAMAFAVLAIAPIGDDSDAAAGDATSPLADLSTAYSSGAVTMGALTFTPYIQPTATATYSSGTLNVGGYVLAESFFDRTDAWANTGFTEAAYNDSPLMSFAITFNSSYDGGEAYYYVYQYNTLLTDDSSYKVTKLTASAAAVNVATGANPSFEVILNATDSIVKIIKSDSEITFTPGAEDFAKYVAGDDVAVYTIDYDGTTLTSSNAEIMDATYTTVFDADKTYVVVNKNTTVTIAAGATTSEIDGMILDVSGGKLIIAGGKTLTVNISGTPKAGTSGDAGVNAYGIKVTENTEIIGTGSSQGKIVINDTTEGTDIEYRAFKYCTSIALGYHGSSNTLSVTNINLDINQADAGCGWGITAAGKVTFSKTTATIDSTNRAIRPYGGMDIKDNSNITVNGGEGGIKENNTGISITVGTDGDSTDKSVLNAGILSNPKYNQGMNDRYGIKTASSLTIYAGATVNSDPIFAYGSAVITVSGTLNVSASSLAGLTYTDDDDVDYVMIPAGLVVGPKTTYVVDEDDEFDYVSNITTCGVVITSTGELNLAKDVSVLADIADAASGTNGVSTATFGAVNTPSTTTWSTYVPAPITTTADTTITHGSVYINGEIATPDESGKITITGGVAKISGKLGANIVLENEAELIVPSGETLYLDYVTITGNNSNMIKILGSVAGTAYVDATAASKVKIEATNPDATEAVISGNADIGSVKTMGFYTLTGTASTDIAAILELLGEYNYVGIKASTADANNVIDTLTIGSDVIIPEGKTLYIGVDYDAGAASIDDMKAGAPVYINITANGELTVGNAKIYDASTSMKSSITVIGSLILDAADVCTIVTVDDEGYVNVMNPLSLDATGTPTSDLSVGYGNTLTINKVNVPNGKEIYVYGNLIVEGANTVAFGGKIITYAGSTMTVNGSIAVEGSVTTAGITEIDGSVTVYRAGGYASWTDSGFTAVYGSFDVTKARQDGAGANTLTIYGDDDTEPYTTGFYLFGTSNISGTLSGKILDYGVLTFNGTSNGAEVEVRAGVTFNVNSVAGTLTVTDEDAAIDDTWDITENDYKAYVSVFDGNMIELTNVKGMTITETVTVTAGKVTHAGEEKAVKYYSSVLSITGTSAVTDKDVLLSEIEVCGGAVSTTAYGETWSYLVGKGYVDVDDITLGKNTELTFADDGEATFVTVSGTVTAVSEGAEIYFTNSAGLVKVEGQIFVNNANHAVLGSFAGKVSATYYEYDSLDGSINKVLEPFEAALDKVLTADDSTIFVYGSQKVAGITEIPASGNVQVTADSTLSIGSDAVLTIAADGVLDSTAGKLTVDGILIVTDKDTGLRYNTGAGMFVYQVRTENGQTITYSGIAGALLRASPGDIITMVQDGYLYSDATIPAGVTLVIPNGKTLTLGYYGYEMTFTVDGMLVLERTASVVEATGADVTIIDNGAILKDKDAIFAPEGFEMDNYVEFVKKIEGRNTTIYSNLTFAAATIDGGALTVFGKVKATDIIFAADSTDPITITIANATGTAQNGIAVSSMTLVNSKVVIGSGDGDNSGIFTGTIIAGSETGDAAITLNNATGMTISAVTEETAAGDVDHFYISLTTGVASIDGTTEITAGTVTMNGNLATKAAKSSVFKVGENAIFVVASGKTFTVASVTSTTNVTVAGLMIVNGTLDVNGQLSVSGILTVVKSKSADAALVDIDGNTTVTGSVIVSEDTTLGGTFNVNSAKLTLGKAATSIGAGASFVGPVNVKGNAYIIAYPNADISEAKIDWNALTESSDAASTTIYVYDTLYATVFADSSNETKILGTAITSSTKITGYDVKTCYNDVTYWFTDSAYKTNMSATALIGSKTAVYFTPALAQVYGKVTVGVGIDLYIDGKVYNPQYGTADKFTVGTHTVFVELEAGYVGDNVTIKFNGTVIPATATGGSFTITADMETFNLVADGATPYTPEPTPEPEKESEWTVTTILLCVLVVLIAIMAVIVALRLNRN